MSPRTLASSAARRARGSGDPSAIADLLEKRQSALGVDTIAGLVFELVDHDADHLLVRSCQRLDEPVIDDLLKRLEAGAKRAATPIFLREFMRLCSASGRREQWGLALRALSSLHAAPSWGARQTKLRFRQLASDPAVLGAVQAAVVGCDEPSHPLLGILAADGGDASVDALLVVFANPANDHLLEMLGTHAAPSPALSELLRQVKVRRSASAAASPALTFARDVLQLDVSSLSLRLTLNSVQRRAGVPVIQGQLSMSSECDHSQWWSVWVSRVSGTAATDFGSRGVRRDELRLGSCSPEDLPRWIAEASRKLGIDWYIGGPSGSLRGKKRDQARAWFFGSP